MTLTPASSSTDRGHLLTEQANPLSSRLDELPTAELVDLFCRNDLEPHQAVAAAAGQLTHAVDAIACRLAAGGRLFYLGAGTSGRLGVLDAAECPPTFCSDPAMVQGVLAGGAPHPFDLVLADPPYDLPDAQIDAVLAALADHGWVGPGSVVVVERPASAPPLTWPSGSTDWPVRRYGDNRLEVAEIG